MLKPAKQYLLFLIFSGDSSLTFLIGNAPACDPISATGVFGIIDGTSTCSSRADKPQIVFSKEYDAAISGTGIEV